MAPKSIEKLSSFFIPVSFEFCGFKILVIFSQNLGNFLFEFALNIFKIQKFLLPYRGETTHPLPPRDAK